LNPKCDLLVSKFGFQVRLVPLHPGLTQLSPTRIHVTVLQGQKRTISVKVKKTGSSALMWTVDDPSFGAASAWWGSAR
jgi:hypothetical protein